MINEYWTMTNKQGSLITLNWTVNNEQWVINNEQWEMDEHGSMNNERWAVNDE
jgi:nuclear transport factor 2 (NTF2) superfamily protein